ncbi:MAG: ABC transporter ATP-binding protein [Candidatus Krumholzibacteriota bacterium]|nr:ABC transporter ATP-binding protein [Candidatus Krumholzibacteriota bacterium]
MELNISNVFKTYPNGTRALQDVSLVVSRGMFGLLGPNGAGKTTLMRSIATLQSVDRGSITLGSIDMLNDPAPVRRSLGYLPQDFGVYPRVSAQMLLDHFATLKGITSTARRRETVAHLLQVTNLWEVRKKKLGSFSGGMKQRFGIAQALLGEPELIIVDEPTAGLDPEERNRFLNLLSEIGENVIVILSTHIVEDVSEVCGRMAIISEGRVLLEGDPRAAINEIRGKTWRKVIEKKELSAYRERHRIISTRLLSGKTVIHVYAGERPDSSFEPAPAELKDVYFTTLSGIN